MENNFNNFSTQVSNNLNNMSAAASEDDEEKELILGKFNTISYDKQTVTLKIVPVNGTTELSTADFTEAINNIYKQSVVEWNITLDDVFYISTRKIGIRTKTVK